MNMARLLYITFFSFLRVTLSLYIMAKMKMSCYFCLSSILQSMFGLPCSTTCDSYMLKDKLRPGFNLSVINHAAQLYNGAPVIEASDEARALR